jgi:RNA polymerase sigma-70 factor (ECF subfamily)
MASSGYLILEERSDLPEAARLTDGSELARRLTGVRDPLARFFARSVRDFAEVDDLVQDVCLRVVRSGGPTDLDHFKRYVFRAANSVLLDRFRSRQARRADQHVAFEPETHAGWEPTTEFGLVARETLKAASAALLELPERTRAVFVLRRLDHRTFPQIAAQLGISVSAVEKHMLRATRHLLSRTEGGQ